MGEKQLKLFKKKKEQPKTIQQCQQEIMDVQFKVLRGFLEMNALKFKLKEMEFDTNELIQEWEALTKVLEKNKEKIKEEIHEIIDPNAKTDSTLI